jgi:hypothetical protein
LLIYSTGLLKNVSAEPTTCDTVAVASCDDLVADVGLEAARVDPECRLQCPHLFDDN